MIPLVGLALVLAGVLAMLPLGHAGIGRSILTRPVPAANRAPWPLWAHGTHAVAAPVPSDTAPPSMSSPSNARGAPGELTGLLQAAQPFTPPPGRAVPLHASIPISAV